ncbi:hypothetical protein [Saccharopolyspora endophytica]|uniref:Uncharacterized protein n=1 Tax=Saccharopolyspora endophytica TaxID=543886 RepID=A0ABS5DA08_9PSEU|nr:hypothetical protein [Saccharopolyspora endophytica]MBQ0923073.1 hypothetical protein [Saccharopolyspora endophytica]
MCYADTTANGDGTATAYCYCGWSENCDTMEIAEQAAERHQNRQDDQD